MAQPARPRAGIFRPGIMAALGSAFNLLALNLALLIVALPVVTLPIALSAAMTALDRWRDDGEERVVREFIAALRTRPPLRTTAAIGVPLAAIALGLDEVHFFTRIFARRGTVPAMAGFSLGLAALLITLTALGYVIVLAARQPATPPAQLWSLGAQLAVRTIVVTGPLFLAEIAAAALVTLADPALLLLGIPVALLALMRVTACLGLRRAEPARS
jgi:hypothetical protein